MSLIKRSLSIYGHATSLALEAEYWAVIDYISRRDDISVSALIKRLDDERVSVKYGRGLAAFIRVWAVRLMIEDADLRDHLKTKHGQ
jgi:predicted DNA-binding ribbon-helix-helix protein